MKKILSLLMILAIIMVAANYLYTNALKPERAIQMQETTYQADESQSISGEIETSVIEIETSTRLTTEMATDDNGVSDPYQKIDLPKLPQAVPLTETIMSDKFGNDVKLSSFKGKPMIINFWATWCPPCQKEMPIFQSLFEEYGEEVNFIMLNATQSKPTETSKKAKEYIAAHQYEFPVYFDQEYKAQMTYAVNSLPSTLIVDAEGMIQYAIRGPISKASLIKVLEELH